MVTPVKSWSAGFTQVKVTESAVVEVVSPLTPAGAVRSIACRTLVPETAAARVPDALTTRRKRHVPGDVGSYVARNLPACDVWPVARVRKCAAPGRRAWTSTTRRARGSTTTRSWTARPTTTLAVASSKPRIRVWARADTAVAPSRDETPFPGVEPCAAAGNSAAQTATTTAR